MYPMKGAFLTSETLLGNLWITLPVQKLFHNYVFTTNFLIFVAFVLTAYTTFLFLFEVTESYWGSLVGGLIFSFSPYRWAHIVHIQLLTIYFYPLCLLFFTRYLKTRKTSSLFWTAMTFCGQFYCCIYMAVTLLTLLTFLLFFHLFAERSSSQRTNRPNSPNCPNSKLLADPTFWKQLAFVGTPSVALLLPLAYQYFRVSYEWSFSHGVSTNSIYSCELFSFLSPSLYAKNYIWLKNLLQNHVRTGEEMNVFTGFIPWILAGVGLSSRNITRHSTLSILRRRFFWAALFMASIMLGPVFIWRNQATSIPLLPYLLVYSIIPGAKAMRVPSRFNQPLLLCTTVLIAIGVEALLQRIDRSPRPNRLLRGMKKSGGTAIFAGIVGALIVLLLLVDYRLVPEPGIQVPSLSQFPEVYQYLNQGDPQRPIVELPMFVSNPPYRFEYFQYQTLHWRPNVGSQGSFVTPATQELSSRTEREPDIRALMSLGMSPADTVIIHPDLYPQNIREKWEKADLSPFGFRFENKFGNDLVWERIERKIKTDPLLKVSRMEKTDEAKAINYTHLWVQPKLGWTYFTEGLVPIHIRIEMENEILQFDRRVEFPTYLLPNETGMINLGKFRINPKKLKRFSVESPLLAPYSETLH